MQICINLFIFFHGHLICVFESHRPNSQLFYPFYYRPGLIDTPCPCYSVCWLWRMSCILWRMLWISWTILGSFVSILVTIYLRIEYCFIVKVFSKLPFCFQFYIPFYCTYCIYFAPFFKKIFHALIFMSYTSLRLMLFVKNTTLNKVYLILSYQNIIWYFDPTIWVFSPPMNRWQSFFAFHIYLIRSLYWNYQWFLE